MLVDLRPKKLTGKAAEAALGRAHITCNKNGVPFDPEKPIDHVRHPPRHAGLHDARLRRRRVPPRRRADRRGARRAGAERRGGQRRGRGGARKQGADGADAPLPDLPALERRRGPDALSLLRQPRHPGEGFPPDRGHIGHPPPPRLPRLRRAVHDLRARAAPRTDGGQALAAGACRSTATSCSARSRWPCASARSIPSGSSA